ncbi:hypothetical protein U1Q18_021367 [Sarracenia purpurea var. burkii]
MILLSGSTESINSTNSGNNTLAQLLYFSSSTSDVPTQSSDVLTQSSDVPTQSSDVPTQSSDVPTQSSVVPTQSSDVPTQSSDVPTQSSVVSTHSSDVPTQFSPVLSQFLTEPTHSQPVLTQSPPVLPPLSNAPGSTLNAPTPTGNPSFHPMQTRSKSGIVKKKVLSVTVSKSKSVDSSFQEPSTFSQAVKSEAWQQAMAEEFLALQK